MKKYLLILLVFLVTILSACSAEADHYEELNFQSELVFNFETGTFNNTPDDFFMNGIYDYQKEFYLLYSIAKSKGIVTEDLTENEVTAFNNFFEKLEILNKHNTEIFILDSTRLKELFEANSIEVEAIDIFTFNAIKNVFDTINTEQFHITKRVLIELIIERELTIIEVEAINYFYDLSSEMYNDNLLDYSLEEVINLIENHFGSLTLEDQTKIEIAYNIFTIEIPVK